MTRPLRIEYPNAWYHVMNRGRRGEEIFSDKKDFNLFIAVLHEAHELFDCRLAAYCLMSNHYHLLLQTPMGNLSRIMRHVNGVYTQRYNRRKKFDGQLFRGRYKSILVEEDSYLLELLRYIHLNPVRAGICTHVADYRWSSHCGYLSKSEKWLWLHKDFLLAMFDDKPETATMKYKEFIGCGDSEMITDFFSKKNRASFFGSPDFIALIKEKYFEQKAHNEIPQARLLAPTIAEIKKKVSCIYDVKESILDQSKRGQFNQPRNVAIFSL